MSSTLSFAGKNFKWNTADDAKEVVEAINTTRDLRTLVLEANTLGIEAAEAIGDALANHPEFERAHWKDLFTGRLKTEIPQALKNLFSGLMRANAKLIELDLSDNALGPVGVEGMVEFMKSPVCYSLQELRLNNNGLGIKGGTMLANAMKELVINAKRAGTPLQLKVFIAGRNRLEKEGAKVYAELFSSIKTLEEIAMPQNGIFHEGIAALAYAFKDNPNLKIANLNDNTFTPKGARVMAQYLPSISNLEVINFGDCLLKTSGAIALANALKNSHPKLSTLQLESNEIGIDGGLAIADSIENKENLTSLSIDCNQFGEEGCQLIREKLNDIGKLEALESLEEDEEPESEEEAEQSGEDEDSDESATDSCDSAQEVIQVPNHQRGISPLKRDSVIEVVKCTADEYSSMPTAARLMGLGSSAPQLLVEEAKKRSLSQEIIEDFVVNVDAAFIHECFTLFMKTASIYNSSNEQVSEIVNSCSQELLEAAFQCAKNGDLLSTANNSLLVHFGVIKCENKSFKLEWDLGNCLTILASIAGAIPPDTKKMLQFFFSRPKTFEDYPKEKHKLISALYRF